MKTLNLDRLSKAVQNYRRLGIEVECVKQVDSSGKNSEVIKVTSKDGKEYLLKFYKSKTEADPRERRKTENNFLMYTQEIGLTSTPKAIATDEETSSTLIEWINGNQITKQTDESIMALGNLLEQLSRVEDHEKMARLNTAADSIQSIEKLKKELNKRIEETIKIAENWRISRSKKDYIYNLIWETKREIDALNRYKRKDYWQKFRDGQVASPSDLGIHNIIKKSEKYYFIDFEYAGRDDLSKAFADVSLQPHSPLNPKQIKLLKNMIRGKERLVDKTQPEGWELRAQDIWELTRFKWCHIMIKSLNSTQVKPRVILCKVKKYMNRVDAHSN